MIDNEILIAGHVMHTNNVEAIAAELNYSPLLIINALYSAERAGKIAFDRKHKTFTVSEGVEVELLAPTDEFLNVGGGINLSDEVEALISNLNGDGKDMSAQELSLWIPGSSVVRVKMLALLNRNLTTYDMTDPKDRKSVYTFLTLKDNAAKQFGAKQFKKSKK